MSQLFICPSCNASLDYDGGNHATVRCSYCGNTVIVPESMRSKDPTVSTLFTRSNRLKEIVALINDGNHTEAVDLYSRTFNVSHEDAHSAVTRLASGLSLGMNQMQVKGYNISTDANVQTYGSDTKAGRNIGCLILFIVIFTVGIILVTTVGPILLSGAALTTIFSSEDPISEIDQVFSTLEATGPEIESGDGGPISALDTSNPAAAELISSFGTKGIAPGQLNDARTLAVAPDGSIYVADRDSGRLQIFSTDGQVTGQWQMDEDKFIDNMTIDRAGHLYTVESSDIFRYDLATGERLSQVVFPEGIVTFNSVAATADNQIVAVNWIMGQIIRFDAEGSPVLVIQVEDVADAEGFDIATVDGNGNIYALGTAEDALGDRQDVVFKFNADGQFLSRFGKSGSEPGTFRAPNAIAVDGQGRIFVGDIFGIHIFDNNGGFLGFFQVDGAVFDMKFNDQGELLVTNRDTIFKYAINVE